MTGRSISLCRLALEAGRFSMRAHAGKTGHISQKPIYQQSRYKWHNACREIKPADAENLTEGSRLRLIIRDPAGRGWKPSSVMKMGGLSSAVLEPASRF